jgi:hypothetical protein
VLLQDILLAGCLHLLEQHLQDAITLHVMHSTKHATE